MNTYKIISGDSYPTLEKLMVSQSEVKSESLREACCEFMKTQPRHEFFGYFLHVETLDLFYVQYHRSLIGLEHICQWHKGKLEKPKMNKYKIISQKLNPSYENFITSEIEIESDTHSNAFKIHCIKSPIIDRNDIYGYLMNMNTLEVFNVCYDQGKARIHESFNCRLEKPKMKKFKVINYYAKITYDNFMAGLEIEGEDVSKAYSKFCQTKIDNWTWIRQTDLVMDVDSLSVFLITFNYNQGKIQTSCEYKETLDKPKTEMKKYKLIPNQNNLNPSYEEMMASDLLIEAHSPRNALEIHRNLNPKVNCGVVLDIESLDFYRVLCSLSTNGFNFYNDCFVRKLEKPEVKPKPMNNLSFKTLTEANNKRLPLFKNSKGLPTHSKSDGSDWSHAEWLQAVIGELGEYANIMKKVQRGDLTMEEAKPSIAKKLADVQTYFSILAQQLNIDLGQAVQDKFNEVSDRVDADVYIKNDVVYSKNNSLISKKEKLKVIKLIRVKSLLTNNVRYFYNSSSNFKNELQSVPKSILLNHKPYEYSPDCIKVNDLLQFIFDDYSTLSYVVTEITYEEDCVSKYESVNKEKEPLQKLMDKHKVRPDAWINNQDYATNAMIVGLVQILSPLFIKKPNQKLITLQDLNNGKVYTRPFTSGLDSITLQEFSKLIVNDATVMKTLQNGKDYEGFNVNVGDMIQFSDDRNVLYSLRVTKIE